MGVPLPPFYCQPLICWICLIATTNATHCKKPKIFQLFLRINFFLQSQSSSFCYWQWKMSTYISLWMQFSYGLHSKREEEILLNYFKNIFLKFCLCKFWYSQMIFFWNDGFIEHFNLSLIFVNIYFFIK
jgi:hypothetical protein